MMKQNILCAVPLSILASQLTMKCMKDLATLTSNIYINQRLQQKMRTDVASESSVPQCDSYICLFEPYKVQSNAQRQQNWYKKL